MASTTERKRNRDVKEQRFCVSWKLSWYKSKLECYNFRMLNVIPMVTTKKIAVEHTQKEMRKELKSFTTKKSTKHKRGQYCRK